MENYTSNQPNAAKLLESLRSSGYDNYSAIADLIDNAFDANADAIKVVIGEGKAKEYVITISDNGDGMDAKTLDQALRLGSITSRDDESLGKYGMGLITASISLGRKLTVITKKDGKYLTGIHDLDEIANKNEFVKEIRDSLESEKNSFTMSLGMVVSGTMVVINKIDNIQNHNITNFTNSLIKHCGTIFRDFLSANKVLMINQKIVRAIDPMMRQDSATIIVPDRSREFINEDGNKSEVKLRLFILPEFTKAEADDKKVNQPTQGFYLMRNNRQIAGGENLNIYTKHGSTNRFRAEIYFDGSMDQMIGVNFKKQNISICEEVRAWIESSSIPHITSVKEAAEQTTRMRKSKENSVDHTPTERTVSLKKSILKKPKIIDSKMPNYLKSLRTTDNFTNVEFTVESNTHLAPLYQIGVDGEKILIKYNVDHIFYQTVFLGPEENKQLISAIDSLVYSTSLALIGITSSEERVALKDDFLGNLSDNLRSLLS